MIITFNELRRIKDRLPSGSSQRIADELGIDVETVRNYFGGKHEAKECVGVHFEPGPDGGVVTLDDTTNLDVAMRNQSRPFPLRSAGAPFDRSCQYAVRGALRNRSSCHSSDNLAGIAVWYNLCSENGRVLRRMPEGRKPQARKRRKNN